MGKALTPIPAQGAAVDKNGMLTLPFMRWFRDLGQNAVEASRVSAGVLDRGTGTTTRNGLSWVASGAVVFVIYQGQGGVSVQLPTAPLVPGVLVGTIDGASVTLSTGTTGELAIPAGDSGHLAGWFFADLRDGGM